MKKVMEKPIEPAPNECCESGCDPCIWDIYRKELRKWEKWQAAQQQKAAEEEQSAEKPEK